MFPYAFRSLEEGLLFTLSQNIYEDQGWRAGAERVVFECKSVMGKAASDGRQPAGILSHVIYQADHG
jgi:hypothetical protein